MQNIHYVVLSKDFITIKYVVRIHRLELGNYVVNIKYSYMYVLRTRHSINSITLYVMLHFQSHQIIS